METFVITDDELKEQVRSQLNWDSRIIDEGILVNVEDYKVTLTGTVPTYRDRLLATEAARLINGIREVDNRLMVSLTRGTRMPSDMELQSNIETIFRWSEHLQDEDIDVEVREKHVTLSGTVTAYWKQFHAASLASEIQGVIDITNELATVPTEQPGDEATAKDIMDAFARHGDIDVEAVDVTVEEGVVTLHGYVPTLDAYRKIDKIARYTFGVISVKNRVTVRQTAV